MAFVKFVGGASKTAQVDDQLFAGTAADTETVTYTLKDEDDQPNQVLVTLSSPADLEDARDQVLTALQNSSNAEFQKITWTGSGTAIILGTAKIAGRPFHLTVAETMAAGTLTNRTYDWGGAGGGSSVASSGPNDAQVDANYQDSAGAPASAPADADDLLIADGADPILYSLAYSANLSSLQLNSLRKNASHTGSVGDSDQGFSFAVDVDKAGGDQRVTVDSSNGGTFWWKGTCPGVKVLGSVNSSDAVRIGGDVDNVRILGAKVRGRITMSAAMTLDNVYVAGVGMAVIEVEENVTSFDLFEANSGSIILRTNPATLKIDTAGFVQMTGDEDFSAVEMRGHAGSLLYSGEGDNTGTWYQTGGRIELRPSVPMAAGTVTCLGGQFTDRHSVNQVSYTAVYGFGGDVYVTDENVQTE
jgi:hypothetical protein